MTAKEFISHYLLCAKGETTITVSLDMIERLVDTYHRHETIYSFNWLEKIRKANNRIENESGTKEDLELLKTHKEDLNILIEELNSIYINSIK